MVLDSDLCVLPRNKLWVSLSFSQAVHTLRDILRQRCWFLPYWNLRKKGPKRFLQRYLMKQLGCFLDWKYFWQKSPILLIIKVGRLSATGSLIIFLSVVFLSVVFQIGISKSNSESWQCRPSCLRPVILGCPLILFLMYPFV